MYLVEKTINKLNSNGYTYFLNQKDLNEVCNHLKKNSYNIYKPYSYSLKNIIYTKELPEIILLEIKIGISIKHSDILGTLFSLGIDDSLFGDIIVTNNHYYFYTFKNMKEFFIMEFTKIKNSHIQLIEKNINELEDYKPNFEEIIIINSSLRIDSVIAKIIHTNRDTVKDLIKDKKIIYNYDILKDNDKILHQGDSFSIRKYGKYIFDDIINTTKKDNLIIRILKYTND